ncbi:hypothetical protein K9M41_04720, partial [Candidatus Gracilibacteria bacterium]|nr:hypothetical protein [Candidatus Gracilibacteria bacterium]
DKLMVTLNMEEHIPRAKEILDNKSTSLEDRGADLKQALKERIPYQSAFFLRLFSNVTANDVEIQALLKKGLSILDEIEEPGANDKITRFSILNKLFEVVWPKQDFVLAQDIIKQQEGILEDLSGKEMPLVSMGPYVLNSLEIYRRLDGPGTIEKIIGLMRDVLEGKIEIPAAKKIFFLVETAKFLPPEQKHDLLETLLNSYQSFVEGLSGNDNFTDFFALLSPEELEIQEERYITIAEREYLTSFSTEEKRGEEYQQLKLDYFRSWRKRSKDRPKLCDSSMADVLEKEGFDLHDQKTVLEAVEIYRRHDEDFCVAEVEIKRALHFFDEIESEEREKILFDNWRIIETRSGIRVVKFFGENLVSVDNLSEIVSSEVSAIIEESPLVRQEFRKIKGIPSYINSLAELIIKIYASESENYSQAFRKAADDYYLEYLARQSIALRDIEAEVVEEKDSEDFATNPEFLDKIRRVFSIDLVEVRRENELEEENPSHQIAKRALHENKILSEKYEMDISEEKPSFWCEIICIPNKEKGIVHILQNKNNTLFQEEINLIDDTLKGKESIVFEGKIRELLVPRGLTVKMIPNDAMPDKYRQTIEEFYFLELEMPTIADATHRIVLVSDNDELLASVAVSGIHPEAVPFTFQRFPNDANICEEALNSSGPGTSLRECGQLGTFCAHPLFRAIVLPKLFQEGAKILQQDLDYKNYVASIHRGVRLLLKRILSKENLHQVSIPQEEQKISVEEMKRRLKDELGWPDKVIESWVKHVDELKVSTHWFSIQSMLEKTSEITNI